jgi:hypothetical protein
VLSDLRNRDFDVLTLHHAEAILSHDMPEALDDIERILSTIDLPIEELVRGGGGEGKLTQRLRREFNELGWGRHCFEIKKIVDGEEKESVTHEIDHVKRFASGIFALEIEWNNKDPFFDRDLENFKRLHADGIISVGAIITRGSSMQNSLRSKIAQFAENRNISDLEGLLEYYSPTERQRQNILKAVQSAGSFSKGWAHAFTADKFGEATTHWRKLEDRVWRGVGNPCPLLLIGIADSIICE